MRTRVEVACRARALEQISQLADGQLYIAQNGSQQAWTNRFPGMDGNGCSSAVGMLQENMAATRSLGRKARLFKRADDFSTFHAGKTGHTETC